MSAHRLVRSFAALGLAIALLGAPTLVSAAPAPAPAATAPVTKGTLPLPHDVQARQLRYAEREAASPGATEFKGNGVGIYIGGSTLAVVLVVVLIVVLL